MRAGISYVMVSMVSSLVFLFGIALIYAATGTLNMAELAVRLDGVPEGTRSALFAVLLVAFGIKAAVFPLSTWLPDSYPTAPAPVTAVFAGLLTKVGVYAIIRAHSLLFPGGATGPGAAGGGAADDGHRASSARSPRATSSDCCRSPWSATSATWCSASRCPTSSACRARSITWRTTSSCRRRCSWWSG